MWAIEAACVTILALYAWIHRRESGWLRDVGLLALAGWIGEETCIVAYGFYHYAAPWHVRIGEVPLLIAAIWPAIVMSARSIARALLRERATSPLLLAVVTGALVVFDAALIEPIAVRAGLWSWSEPGLFDVPVIGIVGWGFFAAAATWTLERMSARTRVLVLLTAPIATHALLLASWWGLFRWILRVEFHPAFGVVTVAVCAALFLVASRRSGAALSPPEELVARGAATLFFAVLLVRRADPWLVGYALAFTPPHLVLCGHAARNVRDATTACAPGTIARR
jgi:uncharacterized membrane protein